VRLLAGGFTKDREPLAYYNGHAEGACVLELNIVNGKLKLLSGPHPMGTNPTFAAFDPVRGVAYFSNENLEKGCVYACRLERNGKLTTINSQPAEGNHPCFLAMTPDNKSVLCANYVSGDVIVFDTADDGSLLKGSVTKLPADGPYPGAVAERQDAPHAHCYFPLGTAGFGLVADLGTDQLLCLRTKDGAVVGKSRFPPGSGPRHVAVSADARWVYVSTELSNTIAAVPADPDTGSLSPVAATLSLQPPGYDGPATTASHIDLSSCGQFAFVGNRMGVGLDGGCKDCTEGTISVIKLSPESPDEHLTLVECAALGGKVPRNFCVVGSWLIVGLQESSVIRSFAIGASGHLTPAHELESPSPGCIVPAKLQPKLRKPKWITVDKLQPETRGVNMFAKVVKSTPAEGADEVSDVVMGDATGVVTLRAAGAQTSICEAGSIVRIQNAKVVMVKGFMRLVVDKWAVLKPAPDHEDMEPKTSNDVSATEYELAG